MTTVISRLFHEKEAAEQAAEALRLQRFSKDRIDVIPASNSAREALIDARVSKQAAVTYAEALQAGQAVLVVRVGFNPRGAVWSVLHTLGEFETLDVGVDNENAYIREQPDKELFVDFKIDRQHRRWLSR